MSVFPEFNNFQKHFNDGKSQLIYTWIDADLETPVTAYLKLCANKDYAFLLESVEGGVNLGRYSAIGYDPDFIWTYRSQDSKADSDPISTLRAHIKSSKVDVLPDNLPPMRPSGLYGYLGYDMIGFIEDIPFTNQDTLEIPDCVMIRPSLMVVFDNVQNKMCIITAIRNVQGDAEKIYADALKKIDNVLKELSTPISPSLLAHTSNLSLPLPAKSNMTQENFYQIVKTAIEYIHAGEIFQTVLSQRFTLPFDLPPFELYRSLRQLNPSPFLFFINFKDFSLVGSSPEILVRVREGKVTIRPIAGTRPRGQNDNEDQSLAEELLSDDKERAEHLMLLDLGRNDVGRVAENGSVTVTDQFKIEYYSHVMHIVSNVEGKLKESMDSIDALFAGFPAGTVSGAPKVRAMEIIEELEPEKRSFYAGCIGYLDGHGDLDTCIALRTALVKDGEIFVQAGGGIVADSNPSFEYQESCNKAKAIVAAAEAAVKKAQLKSQKQAV